MIKSKLKPNKTNAESEYPRLMQHKDEGGLVVLFSDIGVGTVVHTSPALKSTVGDYKRWEMIHFKPYNGKVVLG